LRKAPEDAHVEEENIHTRSIGSEDNQMVEWRYTWSVRSLWDRPAPDQGETVVIRDGDDETGDN
jgi:hypothetical protein